MKDLTSERTEQLWIDSPSHFLSWPCCLDDPLLLCAGRSVSRSKHCDGAEVLDNPLHTRKHTKVRLVHFDRLWLNTSGRRSLLASRSRVLPSWPQYNQHTLHYSPDSSQSGKQTFASLQPPYTPRRWLPPIHGQGCRSPAQLLTAFPSLMNRSASVVLVRLAPVHFWASHQGLLLVRRCDALGTTLSLQCNQPMHARRTYDRGRSWQLSAAGATPWAAGLHCALLASCGCVLASTVPRPTIGWHGCLNHFICILLRHSFAAESAGNRFPLGRQLTWGPCATHVLYVVLGTAVNDTESPAS